MNGRSRPAAALSPEAEVYQALLYNHIKTFCAEKRLSFPCLLTDARAREIFAANGSSNSAEAIGLAFEDLQASFDRNVNLFQQQYGTHVEGYVGQLEISSQIEIVIRDIVDETLAADDQQNWGRVVALSAFLRSLVLQCLRSELPHVVEPVIRCAACGIDEDYVDFIRQSGGWIQFVHHFKSPSDAELDEAPSTEPSNMLSRIALGAGAIGAVGLALFFANK